MEEYSGIKKTGKKKGRKKETTRTLAGFYTAVLAGKYPADFDLEVNRWLHDVGELVKVV